MLEFGKIIKQEKDGWNLSKIDLEDSNVLMLPELAAGANIIEMHFAGRPHPNNVSSIFSVLDIKEHSVHKSIMGSFFSRKSVLRLEHVIQEGVSFSIWA